MFLDAEYQPLREQVVSDRVCSQPGASAPKSGEKRSAPLDNATSTLTLRISTQEDFDFLYNLLKVTMQDYVAQIWG